ncbi:MAG: hypothetical protein M1837_005550 [Sclerophora amabilis]|nr:MAG: hypothetical protein M1837_005550 [Sclerophora amabilis]
MDASAEFDDVPVLSTAAQAALKDFYSDQEARLKRFEDLKVQAEKDAVDVSISMEDFAEDWNASQFWYDEKTAVALAEELLEGSTDESRIACISAPSVFIQLKKILVSLLLSGSW